MPLPHALLLSLVAGFAQAAPANEPPVERTIPIPATTDGAVPVPPDFFGFGFESGFVWHYDNDFSDNIIESVNSRMAGQMVIRVGGTSGDRVGYDPNQDEAAKCWDGPNCPNSNLNSFILGPAYFNTFRNRFKNAKISFQAPMDYDLTKDLGQQMDNTMTYIREAWNAIGPERVDAIALGNEPGYYKDWNADLYVEQAQYIEGNVTEEFQLEGDAAKIFQYGEIASKPAKNGETFGIRDLIDRSINGNGLAKYAAEHYYQNEGDETIPYTPENVQEHLMSHVSIAETMKPYVDHLNAVREANEQDGKDVKYVLSEVSGSIAKAPIKFGGGFGSAMWIVDFHLYAMSQGIQRVMNTMRPVAKHSFWVPDDSGPKTKAPVVQGIFPSAPFIADFVGTTPGNMKVLSLPEGQRDHLTAYAKYNADDRIERVAVVNLKQWDSKSEGMPKRGFNSVTLEVPDGVQSASVRRMHAEAGSIARGFDLGGPAENTTWAGMMWSKKLDDGVGHWPLGHPPAEEKYTVENGRVTVKVPDTEAIIVDFL